MTMRSWIISGVLLALPMVASAHGTMQKNAEGKYLLNMSSAPMAPYVGQEQQNIIALSDIPTNNLIVKNSVFDIQIKKNGAEVATFRNLVATGGLLQFNYAYPEAGLYEMYVKFRLSGETHVYEPEDYWVQVIPKPAEPSNGGSEAAPAAALFVVGIGVGAAVTRRKISGSAS